MNGGEAVKGVLGVEDSIVPAEDGFWSGLDFLELFDFCTFFSGEKLSTSFRFFICFPAMVMIYVVT